MPLTADGELHLYRIVALDHSLRVDDPFWPRYSSGLVYGYGAPLFNYFSPLAFYLPRQLHLLGLSFQQAWLASMIVYTLAAAAGAYLLARAWFGETAGWIAAAAYAYSPYFLFDSLARGTLSETAALALLPWVMWALYRVRFRGQRVDFALAILLFSLFIPLHNIVTLHAAPILGFYALLMIPALPDRARAFLRLALCGLIPLLMTAFFWWPALAESDAVKINDITQNLPYVNPLNHLRSIDETLRLPITADLTQMQAPIPITLGWPQIFLALAAGFLMIRGRYRRQRSMVLFFVIALIMLLYMNLEASAWLWKRLPLVQYTQFAWRTLGPASLVLAILAAAGGAAIIEKLRWGKMTLTGIFLTILILYAIPWLYRSPIADPSAENIVDFQNMERETGLLAASSFSEYVPRWNQAPLDSEKLREHFASAEVIPRLTPPEGVMIESAEWRGTSAMLQLNVEEETDLIFDWLYMPGWTAALNGESTPVEPSSPEGLIRLQVPAGNHELSLSLEQTPIQRGATLLSLAAAAFFLLLIVYGWRFLAPESLAVVESNPALAVDIRPVIVVGIALFALKGLVIDQIDTPLRRERFANGASAGVEKVLEANFNREIVLIGVDFPPNPVQPGENVVLNLYWRLFGAEIESDYSSILHLRDRAGNLVAEYGSFMPGDLATSNWFPGEYYLQERVNITIPEGTPPGNYALDVGLFLPETQQRLNLINAAGNPEDVKVIIGEIIVSRPSVQRAKIDPSRFILLREDILLQSGDLPESVTVGDELNIEWKWAAPQRPAQNYQARLAWLDKGNLAALSQMVPLVLDFPARDWSAGEIWIGRHRLVVPADPAAGIYQLVVQLLDESGVLLAQTDELQSMSVQVPPRSYDLPEIGFPLEAEWSNGIVLKGYDVAQDDAGITLTLYWQTWQALHENLRLFVHLLDSEEQILGISDGIPVDWTRPTTGWVVGEVITTSHRFDTAPNTDQFRVGWYLPAVNQRILLQSGSDSLMLDPE